MKSGYNNYTGITKYTIDDNRTEGIWYDGSTFIGDGKTSFADDNYTDDAARQLWGGTWRIPTYAEWDALINPNNFTWEWTLNYNSTGKNGMLVTSKVTNYTGNSIFLPAAGRIELTTYDDAGSKGYYWSSSLSTGYSSDASNGRDLDR